MARVYFESNDGAFTVNNSNTTVYGVDGDQTVTVVFGVAGFNADQNIEKIIFSKMSSEYTYKQAGNQIQLYFNDSLVATIPVQGDSNGTELIFANGSANAVLTNRVMVIGKASSYVALDVSTRSFDSNLVIPTPTPSPEPSPSPSPSPSPAPTADVVAPTLTSSTPADNATAVAVGANIVLNFDENVTTVAGKNIVVKKTSDNSTITTIAATDAQVTGSGTSTITINPTSDLGSSTEYYVLIDSGAFKDSSNNNYTGISSTTALSFTTEPVLYLSTIAAGTGGFAINGEAANDNSGRSVSSAGDVNGDGLADIIVGAQSNSSSTGRSYVIFGGSQWLTTYVGSTGTVTGTAAAEAIIGSSSSDTLTGGDGIDRFYSGDSNDVIVLTASDITNLADNTTGSPKAVINGGGGIDTIRLTAGANLNLTSIANQGASGVEENSRIESIEKIDLATDTTANILTLTVNDVIDMSGMNLFNTTNGWTNGTYTLGASVSKHQIVIDGTAADSLVINTGNGVWANGGDVTNGGNTYNVYDNVLSNAQILVLDVVGVTNNDA